MTPQKPSWLEAAARVGYATKGIVYGLVGGLAVASVFGSSSGSVGGSRNAVQTIGQQPFGQILLYLVGAGLFGYALWRFVQAYYDPESSQRETGGTIKRLGYATSGAIHVALGVAAFQLATGGSGTGGRSTFFGDLIRIDGLGPALGVIAAVCILGYAAYDLYKAVSLDFAEKLRTRQMSPTVQRAVVIAARAGLTARAVVFGIIGVGVFRAAIQQNPGQVQGVGGALREVGSQPFGAILLVAVAGGLAAYGAYQLAMSRYRRLPA